MSKMTKEEVIKIVNENAVPVFPLQIEYQDWLTAMAVVREALEKQIPKKPVNNHEYKWFECPTCGLIVGTYYSIEEKHHCKCGQAIDWSDEI